MIIYNESKSQILESYDPDLGYLTLDKTIINENEEEIYVFTPYTQKELENRQLLRLRQDREGQCFAIVNRGLVWYNALTEEQKIELNNWYLAWLDVTETKIVPEKPEWLK